MAADPLDTLVTEKAFWEHTLESTRRTFLKQAAGLSAACMVGFDGQSGAEAAAISAGAVSPGAASWYDRPMRWAQLSFVEDDPGNYDMQFWLDYFQRIHADATVLNAGGALLFTPRRSLCTTAASGWGTWMPSATLRMAAGKWA